MAQLTLQGLPENDPGPPFLTADRFDSENRRHLGSPGMRAFLNIANAWGLCARERRRILGFPAKSTYYNWAAKAKKGQELLLPVDTLLRISAVLGIHRALRILFASPNEEFAWLRNPHNAPTFGGQPPMTLVTSGSQDGIVLVRRYLDAFVGRTFPQAPCDR